MCRFGQVWEKCEQASKDDGCHQKRSLEEIKNKKKCRVKNGPFFLAGPYVWLGMAWTQYNDWKRWTKLTHDTLALCLCPSCQRASAIDCRFVLLIAPQDLTFLGFLFGLNAFGLGFFFFFPFQKVFAFSNGPIKKKGLYEKYRPDGNVPTVKTFYRSIIICHVLIW